MNTAMGILINYMRANFHLNNETEEEFIKALAAEKHQIEQAFDDGLFSLDEKYQDCKDGVEYYNKLISK